MRHLIFDREKPDKADFLFVNVAYDKKLIQKREKGLFRGNQEITDRKKLARFFRVLNQKPDNHRFLLCDIFFQDPCDHALQDPCADDPAPPCPDDSRLMAEMAKMRNLIIPYHKNEETGQWEFPIFQDIERGVADYTTGDTKGTFLKFTLMDEGRKTIPLLMYETPRSTTNGGFIS